MPETNNALEPIVAPLDTAVVVKPENSKTKIKAKPKRGSREVAFGQRLSKLMDKHPDCPPGHGRNTWLKVRLMHQNVTVSIESIRKWLDGEMMPRRKTMTALAKTFKTDEVWLAMGERPMPAGQSAERIAQLEKALNEIVALSNEPDVLKIAKEALQ